MTDVYRPQQYGWICVKCGNSNAPWLATCPCSSALGPPYEITSTKTCPTCCGSKVVRNLPHGGDMEPGGITMCPECYGIGFVEDKK